MQPSKCNVTANLTSIVSPPEGPESMSSHTSITSPPKGTKRTRDAKCHCVGFRMVECKQPEGTVFTSYKRNLTVPKVTV